MEGLEYEYDVESIEECDLDKNKIRVELEEPQGEYKTITLKEELQE